MRLHPLTLRFSGDSSSLETRFQSENIRASLPHNRAALLIGALFYAAFGILDMLLMPEKKSTAWLIRYAVVDPLLIGTFLVSFSRFFERYANLIMTVVSIVAGGGIIIMIITSPPLVNYSYYAGIMLVFMWSYTFVRISFLWAAAAGWVQVVLYEIAAIWISPTPFVVLINNNFFFISANIMGMIACYSLEYYTRRNFFLTWQIDMEREKTISVNRELENRKLEYQIVNRALEKEIAERKQIDQEREMLVTELQQALADVKTLRGLIPICSNCKKIRDDQGYWKQIEGYISEHSAAVFSHSICPDCMHNLYPDFIDQ